MKQNIWCHGEVLIKKVKGGIPKGAKKVSFSNGEFKLADSETTGNHHLLEEKQGMELYEKDGVYYLATQEEAVVKCVDQARHDTIKLDPCEEGEMIVFDIQPEVDHLTDEIRNVQD